jgi:hypothetical protein
VKEETVELFKAEVLLLSRGDLDALKATLNDPRQAMG